MHNTKNTESTLHKTSFFLTDPNLSNTVQKHEILVSHWLIYVVSGLTLVESPELAMGILNPGILNCIWLKVAYASA